MPLVNPLKFIKKAQEKGVAIVAFNVHNLHFTWTIARPIIPLFSVLETAIHRL
jgi:hypothetical protein